MTYRQGRGAIGAAVIGLVWLGLALAAGTVQASARSAAPADQAAPSAQAIVAGRVQSGDAGIAGALVTLAQAGAQPGNGATPLGSAVADGNGLFRIAYAPPADPNAVLYLLADADARGGRGKGPGQLRGAVRVATVLGVAPRPEVVILNERTTVATAFTMAQFLDGANLGGNTPGVQNSAGMLRNLVDVNTGLVGAVLGNPPNGLLTTTLRQFNALANMAAACVAGPAACSTLFDLANPPRGGAPRDTLQALVNVARSPWRNVPGLFDQSRLLVQYQPALERAPDAWTLAVKFTGNGQEFDGPGNMAVDRDGSLWITNNYVYNPDRNVPTCGGKQVLKLTATGADALGAPFAGGGVNGAGFGITLDSRGDVWVGNFGFFGQGCPPDQQPPGNSVSQFDPAGQPLSPDGTGWTQGNINQPQGTVADQQGNIWIANCGNNTITQFPLGDPSQARNFGNLGLNKPFDIAIDARGNLWVTNNGGDSVAALAPDGTPLPGSPYTGGGLSSPIGLALDSQGNVWVANPSILGVPCPLSGLPDSRGSSVTLLRPNGKPAPGSPFTGGGLKLPWGVAVDGNDTIWVANFGGGRLTQLCGARPSACPPGAKTGDAISPPAGYSSDALMRNTGVEVDPSGNVWLANNWLIEAVQANPGGDGLVAFIGIAAPVRTPLIGPVQAP